MLREYVNYPCAARRNLHFMESVISIYESLNAAVGVHLPQLQIRNGSNRPQDGGSEDSEMIDKDVIKGNGGGSDSSSLDGSPLPASESDNSGNHVRASSDQFNVMLYIDLKDVY